MSESEGPYRVEHSGSAGWWVVNTAGERLGWFSGKSDACKAVRFANAAHAAALASSKPSAAFVACGDANVDRVCEALRERSRRGQAKYGTTTERTDIDLAGWLQHLQEELLDASVYVERLKAEVALALAEKEAGTTK